jgi:hypothetical protein
MSARKHADLWSHLADEAAEDEIERAASVSVEQAEAELRAAGFDVAEERAKANAFLDALEGGSRGPAVSETPPRSQRRRSGRPAVVWLAAAASIGAVAGGTLVSSVELPLVARSRPHKPSAAELASAAQLRRDATIACGAKQWSVCLADLDKARAVDPDGDDAQVAKDLRGEAVAEILKDVP